MVRRDVVCHQSRVREVWPPQLLGSVSSFLLLENSLAGAEDQVPGRRVSLGISLCVFGGKRRRLFAAVLVCFLVFLLG